MDSKFIIREYKPMDHDDKLLRTNSMLFPILSILRKYPLERDYSIPFYKILFNLSIQMWHFELLEEGRRTANT
jgi:hypothetical protein